VENKPTPEEEEEEIDRKQEAQCLAFLHSGFTDMINLEAIKKYGPDFHGAHNATSIQ